MIFVTKNKVITSVLLTVIFIILMYHSIIAKYIHESFSIDDNKIGIHIINMDKDKERYNKIMKLYLKSDLPNDKMIRYPAVLGKKIEIEKWLSTDALNELYLLEKNGYRTHHHSLTRGAIGCFLSHYYLAKKLLDDNVDTYLVLEDDTRIYTNTFQKIKNVLENAPEDWDIILFYTIRAVGRKENADLNKLKSFWGTNCYIINKKGAKKFVDEVNKNKIDGQIDSYLSRMIQQEKMKIYASKTHFVSPNSTESNIQVILKPKKGVDPYNFKGYKI